MRRNWAERAGSPSRAARAMTPLDSWRVAVRSTLLLMLPKMSGDRAAPQSTHAPPAGLATGSANGCASASRKSSEGESCRRFYPADALSRGRANQLCRLPGRSRLQLAVDRETLPDRIGSAGKYAHHQKTIMIGSIVMRLQTKSSSSDPSSTPC
jgi:hypothetical protein